MHNGPAYAQRVISREAQVGSIEGKRQEGSEKEVLKVKSE